MTRPAQATAAGGGGGWGHLRHLTPTLMNTFLIKKKIIWQKLLSEIKGLVNVR